MGHYEYDDERQYFQVAVPRKVIVSRGVFYTLCGLSALGVLFLLLIVFAG